MGGKRTTVRGPGELLKPVVLSYAVGAAEADLPVTLPVHEGAFTTGVWGAEQKCT